MDNELGLGLAEESVATATPEVEPEAIPLGPETQAIIIQSIN